MAIGKIISYSLYGVTISAAAFGGFMVGKSLETDTADNDAKTKTETVSRQPTLQTPTTQPPPQAQNQPVTPAPPPAAPAPIPPLEQTSPTPAPPSVQPTPPQVTAQTPAIPPSAPQTKTTTDEITKEQQAQLQDKVANLDTQKKQPDTISKKIDGQDTNTTQGLEQPDAKIDVTGPPTQDLPELNLQPVNIRRCAQLGKRNNAPAPKLGLRAMIGQMIIIGFQGKAAGGNWAKTVSRQLRSGTAGGVLFLRHNIGSRANVAGLTRLFNAQSHKGLRPFLMIDQEGGLVQRLGKTVGLKPIPRASTVAKTRNLTQATQLYANVARNVKRLGFNVNLGPVSDVNINPKNPVIARFGRAYSANPLRVAQYSAAFVNGAHRHGVITSLKHFPGHGSSTRDSHKGFVDITKTWNEKKELAAFKGLIDAGCADMVMIGHLVLRNHQDIKGQVEPATFSKYIVTGMLRQQLGFNNGVVVSDDMDMGAIRKFYKPDDALIQAIDAGIDLLLVSNTANPKSNRAATAVEAIFRHANKPGNAAFKQKVKDAYQRIFALKQRLNAISAAPIVARTKAQPRPPASKKITDTEPPAAIPQDPPPPAKRKPIRDDADRP